MKTWNQFPAPIPNGTEVFFVANNGAIHQGQVSGTRLIRLRENPSLGKSWRVVVDVAGKPFAPLLVCLADDHQGRRELFQMVFNLSPGAADCPK